MGVIKINATDVSAGYRNDFNDFIEIPLNEEYEIPQGNYLFEFEALEGYIIDTAAIENMFGGYALEVSEDRKTIVESITIYDYQEVNITIREIIPSDSNTTLATNKVYLMEQSSLVSLSNESLLLTWGENSERVVDLSEFIINLLELPFEVPSDLIGDDDNIQLGNYEIATKAALITSDEIVIEVGSINVPYKYNNSFDYIGTKIVLHLPYVESIELLSDYVINHTLTVRYYIDLYSGRGTVIVISDKTNCVIESKRFTIGRKIPITTGINKKINDISNSEGLNNLIQTAFIEVIRDDIVSNNAFNNEVVKQSLLSDVTGFITVSNILLQTDATLNEQHQIMNVLKSGVYIK